MTPINFTAAVIETRPSSDGFVDRVLAAHMGQLVTLALRNRTALSPVLPTSPHQL